jgi:hypothetical protein
MNIFKKIFEKVFFEGTKSYWEVRYKNGGNSGSGSYEKFAEFKATILNEFIIKNNISKMIELGCGDGNQLGYFSVKEYFGYDVSKTAISICKNRYKSDESKHFAIYGNEMEFAELVISLDVLYHLVEFYIFEDYMFKLFKHSTKYVIIYSSNDESLNKPLEKHIKHRKFTKWISENIEGFKLISKIPNIYPFDGNFQNSSFADFYIYERTL